MSDFSNLKTKAFRLIWRYFLMKYQKIIKNNDQHIPVFHSIIVIDYI